MSIKDTFMDVSTREKIFKHHALCLRSYLKILHVQFQYVPTAHYKINHSQLWISAISDLSKSYLRS